MFTVTPIGVIRTPYDERYRAPRQPGGAPVPAEGIITLESGRNFEQALEDLAGFERIWLIYLFDRNNTWKPKVLPPRGGRRKRGVFATRSPHRPNPIGLSLVRLLEVKGVTLRVAEVDLLDGTPILDIKPYLPFVEAFPESRMGWLDDVMAEGHGREGRGAFAIEWLPEAAERAEWLAEHYGIELRDHAEAVLSTDPAPHPYRRITPHPEGDFQLAIKSWRLRFLVERRLVRIMQVESGYSVGMMATADDGSLHDQSAHQKFHERWMSDL